METRLSLAVLAREWLAVVMERWHTLTGNYAVGPDGLVECVQTLNGQKCAVVFLPVSAEHHAAEHRFSASWRVADVHHVANTVARFGLMPEFRNARIIVRRPNGMFTEIETRDGRVQRVRDSADMGREEERSFARFLYHKKTLKDTTLLPRAYYPYVDAI